MKAYCVFSLNEEIVDKYLLNGWIDFCYALLSHGFSSGLVHGQVLIPGGKVSQVTFVCIPLARTASYGCL